jgi:RNA polymerase sigma-70 factor, ECF subfamily
VTASQEAEFRGLMQRAQAGDQQAYHALLTALVPVVRRYVEQRSSRAPWTDDAVQDILWALHQARQTWNPGRPFAPWCYALMQHRLVDAARKASRVLKRESSDEAVLAAAPDRREPDDQARRAEAHARVVDAVEALPPRQREVVRLLKLEERPVREVAGRLGLSESNVKVTAHRAYRVLRERLGGWWHGA